MKTRSLILPDVLIRAALAGRVTEIRVPVRPQPDEDGLARIVSPKPEPFWRDTSGRKYRCPLGVAGDRLVGREVWGVGTRPDPFDGWVDGIEYRADEYGLDERDMLPLHRVRVPEGIDLDSYSGRWRGATEMPLWASRCTFDVLSSRFERLHDITDEGAIASGAYYTEHAPRGFQTAPGGSNPAPGWAMGPTTSSDECLGSARFAYGNFWNRWHAGENWNLKPGPAPWDLNPWIWCAKVRRA